MIRVDDDVTMCSSPSKKRKKGNGYNANNFTGLDENRGGMYERKENLELSLQNQFGYSAKNVEYSMSGGIDSSAYGYTGSDMNGSAAAGPVPFVLTKPKAPRRSSVGGKWNKEEDDQLRAIVQENGARNWKKVASLLGDTRTDVQCLHRWNKVLKPGLSKGNWTPEEDHIVKSMVLACGVGHVKWSAISQRLPGRLGKQCRERWFNSLDPIIKRTEWTPAEEMILYQSQRHFGNRWKELAKMLPGRAENAVKNRWNSIAMRKWMEERSLQPGDGSSTHVSSKEGMLEALEAFKRSLAEAGVELEVDISSAAVIDKLLGDVGRNGEKGSTSRKGSKSSHHDHLEMILMNSSHQQQQQFHSLCDNNSNNSNNMLGNNDSDYERDSDGCEDDDSHSNNATTLASMGYLDVNNSNNMHNTHLNSNNSNSIGQYPVKMQQMGENDEIATDELVEILKQLRRTSSCSPTPPINSHSLRPLPLLHNDEESSKLYIDTADNSSNEDCNAANVSFDFTGSDSMLGLLSPSPGPSPLGSQSSMRPTPLRPGLKNSSNANDASHLLSMGLVNTEAQPLTTTRFEMDPPVSENNKKSTRSSGRSISFAEDFIYDSSDNKQDVTNMHNGIAASRRRTFTPTDTTNTTNNTTNNTNNNTDNAVNAEYGVDNMLPPLPSQRRIPKSLAVGAVPFRHPSTAFPVPHGSFVDKESSEYSMTMPLSPASIALKKLKTKLNTHRKKDNNNTNNNTDLEDRDRDADEDGSDDDEEVPLECLGYFKHLAQVAKKNLMKQLISRFQRTSFTPRHHALLNTPGKLAASTQNNLNMNMSHNPNPNPNHSSQGQGMMAECMIQLQLQSASICSLGGVGAFSEDPCLFNHQFGSMDSLDSHLFEMSDFDYFVEQNQLYGTHTDPPDALNNSLDVGDLSGLYSNQNSAVKPTLTITKPSKNHSNGLNNTTTNNNSSSMMSINMNMLGLGSTVTPSMSGGGVSGSNGTLYDEAAIEAAAEIAFLMTICCERRHAEQLLKAVLADNLSLLNVAAMAIISSSNNSNNHSNTGRVSSSITTLRKNS